MSTISKLDDDMAATFEATMKADLTTLRQYRNLSDGMRQAVAVFEEVVEKHRKQTVNDLWSRIDELDTNRAIIPEHGWEQERETLRDVARARMEQMSQRLEAAQKVAESTAALKARPDVDTSDLALRDELRTRLHGVDAEGVVQKAISLAQGPRRDLAALLASDFGESVLEGLGADDPGDLRRSIAEIVADTAADHGLTDSERQAGQALQAIRTAGKSLRIFNTQWTRHAFEATDWTADREVAARDAYTIKSTERIRNAALDSQPDYMNPARTVGGARMDR